MAKKRRRPYPKPHVFHPAIAKLYLIRYLCGVKKKQRMTRTIYFSNEFWDFYHRLQPKVQEKFDYVLSIVRTERVITTKFVKRLENTELYEMRVSVATNEYRTILFAIDHDNILNATKIFVLNAFLKKSTKDYRKQIETALHILGGLSDDTLE